MHDDKDHAATTTEDIRAAARDMLRMGSRWAHSALDWIDERRHEMSNRHRDERDYRERSRDQYSPYSASGQDWQDRDRHATARDFGGRREQLQGRSDRDIQGDYSGGGYDQVGERSDWSRRSEHDTQEYGQRSAYEREGSRAQRRAPSSYDDGPRGDYGGYGAAPRYGGYGGAGAGYGYDTSAPGGVGYGAPGYGAGSSYAESRYHGDFQSRSIGEEEGIGSDYGGERGYQAEFGRSLGRGRDYMHDRRPESYGQAWREERSFGGSGQDYGRGGYGGRSLGQQGYARGDLSRHRDVRAWGYGAPGGLQGDQARESGRSYRGVGPRNYTRSDERIREDLNERLTEAHDIDASLISVEVNNGVATLSGTVDERWMKHRAEDIADGCTGVRDVRNMIQVQPQPGHSAFGGHSQGSQYGSSRQGTSSYGGSTPSSGSQASGSASPGSLGTGSASSQGSSLGAASSGATSQGSTTRASSPGSTGPNV